MKGYGKEGFQNFLSKITTGKNVQEQQEKEHAFREERILSAWAKYSKTTLFSEKDFRDLFFYFEQEVKDGQCSFQQFNKLFYIVYPIKKDPLISKLSLVLFKRIDRNRRGRINFQEFIHWLSKMTHGGDNQRMMEIFKIYDADKNDVISRFELVFLLQSVDRMSGDTRSETNVFGRIHKIIHKCDRDRDGQLNLKEFLTTRKLEPIVNMFKDRHLPFVEKTFQEWHL